ncbi:hypothetical protein [Acinetobacter piscicola]|uniref:hypothetical protein n=1 Tax=Acinetobacter piscicola TaxID=2006115 RepID=UPI000B7FA9DC|nr:hypothetical protein [Acinetobacter piscicola]
MSSKYLNKAIWKDFLDKINDEESVEPVCIYLVIRNWILENIDMFSNYPFSNYKILEYCNLDMNDYPIYKFQFDKDEFILFIKNLNRYSFNDQKSIARILSEIFEYLFVLRVNILCSFCDSDGLLVLKNVKDSRLVYECPQCGNAIYVDNNKQSIDKLTLPNRLELENYKLLPK